MTYRVDHKKVSFTGKVSLGWVLGHGCVIRNLTATAAKYVVIKDGSTRPIAICSGRASAELICDALNKELK